MSDLSQILIVMMIFPSYLACLDIGGTLTANRKVCDVNPLLIFIFYGYLSSLELGVSFIFIRGSSHIDFFQTTSSDNLSTQPS